MVKYKILWEALKETAETMTEIEGFDDTFRWSVLSKMMKDGEEMFGSMESHNGTALFIIIEALEFGFACLGVIALVMHVIA